MHQTRCQYTPLINYLDKKAFSILLLNSTYHYKPGFQWCGFHSCAFSKNSQNIQLMQFSLNKFWIWFMRISARPKKRTSQGPGIFIFGDFPQIHQQVIQIQNRQFRFEFSSRFPKPETPQLIQPYESCKQNYIVELFCQAFSGIISSSAGRFASRSYCPMDIVQY